MNKSAEKSLKKYLENKLDQWISKQTEPYKVSPYKIRKKAEYTLFSYVLIAIYAVLGIFLMRFEREMGYLYTTSIVAIVAILMVVWWVFKKGHLLMSQYILLSAGILATISHLYMQLNFHFYVQILLVLIVGYIVHLNQLQIRLIVLSLLLLMIGRSAHLYLQYTGDQAHMILLKQNVFIVASVLMIMVFVHYFNRIIANEIEETHQLAEISNLDVLTGLLCRNKFNQDVEALNRNHVAYCLAVIDIDLFKIINDHYGHDVGD